MKLVRMVVLGLVIVVGGGKAALAGDGARIVYVDDSAPAGGDGSSWARAYRFLQDALQQQAFRASEVRVAQGRYEPDRSEAHPLGTRDRTASFMLRDGTRIVGGFDGLTGRVPNARNPRRFVTILSGDLNRDDGTTDPPRNQENSFHVVESWNNAATAELDGFVISGGRANRPIAAWDYTQRRDDSGAGMMLVKSHAVVRICVFRENQADAQAHIWIALEGTFSGVNAGGGAMLVVRGAPTITDCVFEDNVANRVGGALNITASPVRVERCLFRRNDVGLPGFAEGSFGAAVADVSGVYEGNRARFEACQFINNGSPKEPGDLREPAAVYAIFSSTDYVNCVWLANQGDAMLLDNSFGIRLIQCVLAGNKGLGIFEISEVGSDVLLYNTIAWGNAGRVEYENPNLFSYGGNFGIYDTIVGKAELFPVRVFDAANVFVFDPRFTNTIGRDGVPWSGDEDLRPVAGSPANDRGNNAYLSLPWMDPVLRDIRGNPRRLDDLQAKNWGTASPIVDLGPYERAPH